MTEKWLGEIVNQLHDVQLELPGPFDSYNDLHSVLSHNINHLITKDFSRLISILYRLDISEKKLKHLLKDQVNTRAGDIIAGMIIERQVQKIETKRSFTADNSFSDEEKW